MNSLQIALLCLIAVVICILFKMRKKKSKTDASKNVSKRALKNASKLGISKVYPNYAAPSPFCDDPCFAKPLKDDREANHAFRMLRMQYDTIIKRHNRTAAKIRRVNAAAKEFDDISGPEMQEVVDLCRKDIMDAPALVEYAQKWAAMQGSDTVYYPTFESFRRLASIYEKQRKYEEAIDVCEQAIRLGLDNYDSKVNFESKRKRLIELADKQATYKDSASASEETTPVRKTAFETVDVDTTREELQAYEIIRSMGIEPGLQDRITYKDTKSYFAILMDGNVRSWICRLRLNSGSRWITFHPENNNKEESVRINQMQDLYQYRDKIVSIMNRYA